MQNNLPCHVDERLSDVRPGHLLTSLTKRQCVGVINNRYHVVVAEDRKRLEDSGAFVERRALESG